MENITEKIKIINYSEKEAASISKFLVSLTDEIISIEELTSIVNYLKANNINITKPSQNKIFANGFEKIKEIVETYKSMGLLNALVEDPLRINAVGSIDRIRYLMSQGIILTQPNGKYQKLLFSKRLFEKTYGALNDSNVEKPPITVAQEFDPLAANMYKGQDNNLSTLFQADALNEYVAVINAPQVPADDDAVSRFDKLYSCAEQLLSELYTDDNSKVSVPDNISEYIMKMVAQKLEDDNKILYYALTYGKILSPEESEFINNKLAQIIKNDANDEKIELESIA